LAAEWELLDGPPAIVRTVYDGALEGDITVGLAERFAAVTPVDTACSTSGRRRVTHAAIAPDGEGITIEALLAPDGEVVCWVAPMSRYRRDLPSALRAGRLDLPRPVEEPPAGIPVAEAYLDGLHLQRRGPAAFVAPAEPVSASALPLWLFSRVGLGPRPPALSDRMVVTPAAAFNELLSLSTPDVSTVRRVLRADASALSDVDAAALASLCSTRPRHWCLDYAVGYDVALEPSDEDWSTATPTGTGHLEILDGGPAGLWRVVRDLPADLLESTSDSVGLVRTTSHAVWHELAILAAG
jgi:hypothetical protein